jgi:Aspartyl protease
VLAIRLRSLDGELQPSTPAIVDSGADTSTFPASMAKSLGITLDESCCERGRAATANGETVIWSYPQGIKALIEDRGEHHLKADFCDGLTIPLLGRKDFFNAYRVTFDERAETLTLEPLGPRDWSPTGPNPRSR